MNCESTKYSLREDIIQLYVDAAHINSTFAH